MTYHSTVRSTRGSLDNIPFELSEINQLQVKLDVGNSLMAITGLPTIQLRGAQMVAEVKRAVMKLVMQMLEQEMTS